MGAAPTAYQILLLTPGTWRLDVVSTWIPSAPRGHPPLEAAIRHWKRPSATGSGRFPTPRISARGRRALLDERARLLLARYMDHGTTQRKWIDSLVSSEDLVRWS